MLQRVFPRTHEPSTTSRRCVCAAAPGLTVRPPASASPQSSSTDGAGQTNFLQCRSGDIIQVDRCTCFRAPDHGTNTRTRIFARVSRLFVEMGGKNLHSQTLTAAPILVTASGRLVGCFFQMALLDRRTSPPSRVGRQAGGWDGECLSPECFGCRRARKYEIGDQHGQCGHVACLQPGDPPVTRPLLAPSSPPAPALRAPPSPTSMPRVLGRVARAMRPHMGGAWSTCSSRCTVGKSRDRPGAGQCLPHPTRPRSPHTHPDTRHRCRARQVSQSLPGARMLAFRGRFPLLHPRLRKVCPPSRLRGDSLAPRPPPIARSVSRSGRAWPPLGADPGAHLSAWDFFVCRAPLASWCTGEWQALAPPTHPFACP